MQHRRLYLAGVTAISVILVAGIYFWPRPTLEDSARRFLDCFRSENVGCLMSYMPDNELENYGLSEQQYEKILKEYIFVKFRGASYETTTCNSIASPPHVLCGLSCTLPSGLKSGVGVQIVPGDNGPIAADLVAGLALECSKSYIVNDPRLPSAVRKLTAWHTQAIKDGPQLEAMGMRGIIREPGGELVPWELWAESCAARLKAVQAEPKKQ